MGFGFLVLRNVQDREAEIATMQHKELLQHIIDRNSDKAGASLRNHLKEISQFVKTLKTDVYLNLNGSLEAG